MMLGSTLDKLFSQGIVTGMPDNSYFEPFQESKYKFSYVRFKNSNLA